MFVIVCGNQYYCGVEYKKAKLSDCIKNAILYPSYPAANTEALTLDTIFTPKITIQEVKLNVVYL